MVKRFSPLANDQARFVLSQEYETYLIVPVGDGTGDDIAWSDSGMFIFNGGKTFVRGGLGTRTTLFGEFSLTSEVNRILTFVDGKRRMHLKMRTSRS